MMKGGEWEVVSRAAEGVSLFLPFNSSQRQPTGKGSSSEGSTQLVVTEQALNCVQAASHEPATAQTVTKPLRRQEISQRAAVDTTTNHCFSSTATPDKPNCTFG